MITVTECLRRSERLILTLVPNLRDYARWLVRNAHKEGVAIQVTQGLRTYAEQDDLYAQGRTKPGKIVTNAQGGFSNHNFGLAFDIVVLDSQGRADWNSLAKYIKVGRIGRSMGLRWGGDFTSIVDRPHYEFTGGLTTRQLRLGARPFIPPYKTEEVIDLLKKGSVKVGEKVVEVVIVDGRPYVQLRGVTDAFKLGFNWDTGKASGEMWAGGKKK